MKFRGEAASESVLAETNPHPNGAFSPVFSFWHPSNMTAIKGPEKWMETIWEGPY